MIGVLVTAGWRQQRCERAGPSTPLRVYSTVNWRPAEHYYTCYVYWSGVGCRKNKQEVKHTTQNGCIICRSSVITYRSSVICRSFVGHRSFVELSVIGRIVSHWSVRYIWEVASHRNGGDGDGTTGVTNLHGSHRVTLRRAHRNRLLRAPRHYNQHLHPRTVLQYCTIPLGSTTL